jgi:hypothetical protein
MGIEIALKDHGKWSGGHDLRGLAARAIVPLPSGVDIQLTALHKSLAVLICTDRHGNPLLLDPQQYPSLRYIRHAADYPAGSSNPKDITDAITAARQLAEELKRAGVDL